MFLREGRGWVVSIAVYAESLGGDMSFWLNAFYCCYV